MSPIEDKRTECSADARLLTGMKRVSTQPCPRVIRLPPSLAAVHEMAPGAFVQYYADRAPPRMDNLVFVVEELHLPKGMATISGAGNSFLVSLDDLRASNLKLYKIRPSAEHPESKYLLYRKTGKGLFSTPFFETPVSDTNKLVHGANLSELDMHMWNVQSIFGMRELVEEPMYDMDLRDFHALPLSLQTRVLKHATVEFKCALIASELSKRELASRDLLPWHECARLQVRMFFHTIKHITSTEHIVKCMLDMKLNTALSVITADMIVAMAHQFENGRIPSGFIGLFVLVGVRFRCNMDAARVERGNVVAMRDINAGEVVALHGNNVIFPSRSAPGASAPHISTDGQLCQEWQEALRLKQRARFDACIAQYAAPSIPVKGVVLYVAGSPLPENSRETAWIGHMVGPPPPGAQVNTFRMPGLCKIVTGVVASKNIARGEPLYAIPAAVHTR